MQLRINVIQFWASIVPMISMIKWQRHTCYCYHYSYYHHFLLSLISWCAVLRNTPGLRDSVVMRVLSAFYWTAATGAGLFTSNSATQQRHAEHCVQAARALCWERVSLTGIPVGNQSDQGNIPDDLSLRGKNMHSMKSTFCAANLQVVRGCHAVAFLAET